MKLHVGRTLFTSLLQQSVSFIVTWLTSRFLGGDAVATLSFVRNLVFYLGSLCRWSADLTLGRILASRVSAKRFSIGYLAGPAIVTVLASAALLGLWPTICERFDNLANLAELRYSAVVCLALVVPQQILLGASRGLGKIDKAANADGILAGGGRLILVVTALLCGFASASSFMWALAFGLGLSVVYLLTVTRPSAPAGWVGVKSATKEIYSGVSASLFLSSAAWLTLRQLDSLIGVAYLTSKQAAAYYVYLSCFSILGVISGAVSSSFGSFAVSRNQSGEMESVVERANEMASAASYLSVPLLCILVAFPDIVERVFGLAEGLTAFDRATFAIYIYVLIVYAHQGFFLSFFGHQNVELALHLTATAISALCMPWLAGYFGAFGIILCMGIGCAGASFGKLIFARQLHPGLAFFPGVHAIFPGVVSGICGSILSNEINGSIGLVIGPLAAIFIYVVLSRKGLAQALCFVRGT